MDIVKKIKVTKEMIGIPNLDDDLVRLYLDLAGDEITTRLYPYADIPMAVPDIHATRQCKLAAFLYLKRGAEGETSHNENGVQRSYENGDIPYSYLDGLTPFVGVIKKKSSSCDC